MKTTAQIQKVAVLLATFNGEKYIAQQLDSLLAQEFKDFDLYISDDGSNDRTAAILSSYSDRFSGRMHILERREQADKNCAPNAACANFLYLLEKVQSDLYLFCDQDDFWLENHIRLLVEKYHSLSEDEKRLPALVYTDLSIADSELNIMHHSDSVYMKRKKQDKHSYFFSTGIRGCACMVNNELKKTAFQNKDMLHQNMEKIEMHDIFVALIASFFGNIYFINVPTLLYRQHGTNTSGGIGKKRTLKEMARKGISLSRYKNSYETLRKDFMQRQVYAEFFLTYFENILTERERKIMRTFIVLSERNKFFRICFLTKNRFLKKGCINNIWLFIVT